LALKVPTWHATVSFAYISLFDPDVRSYLSPFADEGYGAVIIGKNSRKKNKGTDKIRLAQIIIKLREASNNSSYRAQNMLQSSLDTLCDRLGEARQDLAVCLLGPPPGIIQGFFDADIPAADSMAAQVLEEWDAEESTWYSPDFSGVAYISHVDGWEGWMPYKSAITCEFWGKCEILRRADHVPTD